MRNSKCVNVNNMNSYYHILYKLCIYNILHLYLNLSLTSCFLSWCPTSEQLQRCIDDMGRRVQEISHAVQSSPLQTDVEASIRLIWTQDWTQVETMQACPVPCFQGDKPEPSLGPEGRIIKDKWSWSLEINQICMRMKVGTLILRHAPISPTVVHRSNNRKMMRAPDMWHDFVFLKPLFVTGSWLLVCLCPPVSHLLVELRKWVRK